MTDNTEANSRPSGPPTPPRVTQPPTPPAFPRIEDNTTRLIKSQPAQRKISVWLWVGLGLVAVALAIAAVLWFISTGTEKDYDYSDGDHVLTEHEVSSSPLESSPVDVATEEPAGTATVEANLLTGHVYLDGELGEIPFTLDLDISPSGSVSGIYWNVLYDLKFQVTGTRDSNDGFSLDMSRDGVTTPLRLTAQGGGRYAGTWGKKRQTVDARLEKGTRPGGSVSSAGAYKVRVSGNGIRALAYITEDCIWYADQGSGPGHRLRVRDIGDFEYEVLSDMGARIATFFLMETAYGVSGTMKDITGKTFEIIGE